MGTAIDGEILNTLLKAFLDVFTLGTQRLLPDALWLLVALLTIELAVLGLWIAAGYHQNMAAALVSVGMKTALYLLLIKSWTPFTRAMIKGFIAYGLKGAGDVISPTDFQDPSRLATYGISAMTPVMNRLLAYTGWDVLWNFPDILFTGVAALGVIVAFVVFGIQVAYALLQFYGTSTATIILIPWGMVQQTAFLAEKSFAAIWSHAVKLLILSLLAGVGLTVMKDQLPSGMQWKWGQVATLAIAGWFLVGLAWQGPKWVQGLLQGSPNLSANDLTQQLKTLQNTVVQLEQTVRSLAPTPNDNIPVPTGEPEGRPL